MVVDTRQYFQHWHWSGVDRNAETLFSNTASGIHLVRGQFFGIGLSQLFNQRLLHSVVPVRYSGQQRKPFASGDFGRGTLRTIGEDDGRSNAFDF